ncbi:fungal-specific transcription factor domain-containing protein [Neohortaea acidophila]|uniref:Fungal-specific transcription factor domain-containing protein n=1 Tax=Neohortaea acidophila TaxID=245834 RepID=A0A6A6PVY5_9PEZI|nr:fungal-specific transcription factor domain-containing protein [Neohortaea acidophila]KAF2483901.1 fungal-specific transcription factor domain-containing protein [Neohortaea acidophila]
MSTGPIRRTSRVVEGSCWTCRRRRIKCDLEKPACERCRQNEQLCNYGSVPPFKWVGGIASRGKNAPSDRTDSLELASPLSIPVSSPASILMSPRASAQLDTECMLLYFSQAVLPRFHLLEGAPRLDLSLLMQDKPLKQAILAVSQTHFDLAHVMSTSVTLTRQQARSAAIRSLRNQLELGVKSANTAQNVFMINVLLCILDGMIEPSNDHLGVTKWHLQGGHAMLTRWPSLPTDIIAKNGLHTHLLSCFATMDLFHALLSGDKPFFDPLLWHMFAHTDSWWGNLPANDRFLGILKCYAEMASLGSLVASSLPTRVGLQLVEKCLPAIEATLLAPPHHGEALVTDGVVTPENWAIFCELYELCGIIYLQRALRLLPIDDPAVQAAVKEGVGKLTDGSLPGMMAHCVVLPLLVLGAHALSPDDQTVILRTIMPSISYLSFGNLQLMADSLRDIWRTDDKTGTWWDAFQALSAKAFLF